MYDGCIGYIDDSIRSDCSCSTRSVDSTIFMYLTT